MNGKKHGKIERFETLPSTNDLAKARRADGEDLIVIARSQTGGRGTKGRSFSSEVGGVYLSVLTFYEDLPASEAFRIMQSAAAAVCETLAAFGLEPKIKWPNDVFVNGKKICGILIENTFSGKNVSSSVVGIGLNVNNLLPPELSEIATTVARETHRPVSASEAEETLLRFLREENIHEKYTAYLGWLGERVTVFSGIERIPARILSVDESGNLVTETKDGQRRFAAAEVSLRTGEE